MASCTKIPNDTQTNAAAAVADNNSVFRVRLSNDAFAESLKRYVDEEKPDPLQKKQMESWRMVWTDGNEDDNAPLSSFSDIEVASFTPSYVLSGTLDIFGEYMILALHILCYWMGDLSNGSFQFTCHASVRPNATHATKLHGTMIQRLSSDEKIRTILMTPTTDSATNGTEKSEVLCSAFLDTKSAPDRPSQIEERVYCAEPVAEGIRRAILSCADSSLDVFDFVCQLPFLSSESNDGGLSSLADRARLRILEEATYDACDNEPDDELVEDLRIREANHDDDEGDEGEPAKTKKCKR
jgi:hypothetical protein